MEQLYTVDKYFVIEQIFNVLGFDVIVIDDVIVVALLGLPEHKRDIILLFPYQLIVSASGRRCGCYKCCPVASIRRSMTPFHISYGPFEH